jgi:hypothetical protein
MAAVDTLSGVSNNSPQNMIALTDKAALRSALREPYPVLLHLNADTTWVLQLPYPADSPSPTGRKRFNILIDPWLQGPQSDVASWFSTQWHVVAPSVTTLAELNWLLEDVEGEADEKEDHEGVNPDPNSNPKRLPSASHIDVVAISHEFTDHCHKATLLELPTTTPIFATDKAATLIRSWKHFETVITTPAFSSSHLQETEGQGGGWRKAISVDPLPSWLGIGRIVTEGNALYYHSAISVIFERPPAAGSESKAAGERAGAVLYSPHGIKGTDLNPIFSSPASKLETLALLHGLHDVGLRMTKQLNLGALNGLEAVRASGAKYWIATHDEVKRGAGFISPMLRRTRYTVKDAVAHETRTMGEKAPNYQFVELGSGQGMVLRS